MICAAPRCMMALAQVPALVLARGHHEPQGPSPTLLKGLMRWCDRARSCADVAAELFGAPVMSGRLLLMAQLGMR